MHTDSLVNLIRTQWLSVYNLISPFLTDVAGSVFDDVEVQWNLSDGQAALKGK